MFSTISGLPAHPLIVHAVVVLLPLAALGGVIVAVWPAARARYAWLALVVATAALFSIPLATESGEKLEDRVQKTALLEKHTDMAEGLLPFAALLWLGLALLVFVIWYTKSRSVNWAKLVTIGAAVLVVAGAVASGVQTVRIGHSGASAAWSDVVQSPEKAEGSGH